MIDESDSDSTFLKPTTSPSLSISPGKERRTATVICGLENLTLRAQTLARMQPEVRGTKKARGMFVTVPDRSSKTLASDADRPSLDREIKKVTHEINVISRIRVDSVSSQNSQTSAYLPTCSSTTSARAKAEAGKLFSADSIYYSKLSKRHPEPTSKPGTWRHRGSLRLARKQGSPEVRRLVCGSDELHVNLDQKTGGGGEEEGESDSPRRVEIRTLCEIISRLEKDLGDKCAQIDEVGLRIEREAERNKHLVAENRRLKNKRVEQTETEAM